MHSLAPLTAPIDPAEALRRVGFLLERSRAHSRRVEAFRGAAATIRDLDPAEVDERVAHGSVTELAGIGPSTAGVIEQAAAGELPDYLARLQDDAGPLVEGGEALTEAIIGDCHTHSTWSDGGSPIEEMVLTAVELGQQWMVLTDHSPRLRIANGLSAARLAEQITLVRAIDASLGDGFDLLAGIEVDILDDGGLDQSQEMLGRLDFVTASVHSALKMPSAAMTRRMVTAVSSPVVNVLGHCTGRLVEGSRGTRPQSTFDTAAVFGACVEHDVAVEINSRPERCDPPDELITLALELGCLFAIDSDAHAPGQLEMKVYGAERATRLGVPTDRVVTTWPADRLREWVTRTRP